MQNKFLRFLLGLCFLSACAGVSAEENAGQAEEWYPPSAGPVTAWTAPLCDKGMFVVQSFFFYNYTRGTFNDDGHTDSLAEGDTKHQY